MPPTPTLQTRTIHLKSSLTEIGWQCLWWVFAGRTQKSEIDSVCWCSSLSLSLSLSLALSSFLLVSETHLQYDFARVSCVGKISELSCQNAADPAVGRGNVCTHIIGTLFCGCREMRGKMRWNRLLFNSRWVSSQSFPARWDEKSNLRDHFCVSNTAGRSWSRETRRPKHDQWWWGGGGGYAHVPTPTRHYSCQTWRQTSQKGETRY